MKLTKNGYKQRIIDSKIADYLKIFGAVSIEGPKWCGKTWTALNHANSVVYLNNTANNFNDKRLADANVELIMNKEYPELIDEWQEVPAIWDAVRFKCDEDNIKGKYILTGSATPNDKDIHHSGAGRIARIKMYTMSLYESGESQGLITVEDLFNNTVNNQLTADVELQDLIKYIIRGGWPEAINLTQEQALDLSYNYLEDVLKHDISAIDGVNRDINKMRRIMRSLARNESTIVNDSTIINDVNDVEDIASKNTILDYIDVLEKLSILENQPAFSTNLRSSGRVGKSAKRHFTDPSLACAVLNLTEEKLLNDFNFLGFLFEALVERDLRIYIESMKGNIFHFRDNISGLEIDSILELANGDYGAIEIKLGTDKIDEAATNLLKFNEIVEKKPKFLCVICGLSNAIYKREDGIYVIPITALKP
ncbi:MAG: ATP-binding protein [Bacilli bacterium]|nr:ATP-binding protein [Bacilli bacterium]